jgi:hypothetical protein
MKLVIKVFLKILKSFRVDTTTHLSSAFTLSALFLLFSLSLGLFIFSVHGLIKLNVFSQIL